ncbi:hypothetical protein [Synechococcus sp. RS9916]|uniref:hypothetical protein n=1 Tax=Synechococcus sp. RS9916 TaxID=221359 RepID=UPI0012EA91DC|nr:hypothetical protein [Synechococcus sp. RS9916]
MQKSLIIVHSDGPVASTSLAGLCEYYGFCFLPLRKFLLEEYISGSIPFYSDKIRHRILEVIISLSIPRQTGGVSVSHRDQLLPIVLTKPPLASDIESFLSYMPTSLEDQIFSCLQFIEDALIYKTPSSSNGYIILTLPRPLLSESLFLSCCNDSNYIRTLVMTRPYIDWCLSLLSQEDSKSQFFNFTRLSCLYQRHVNSLDLQNRFSEIPISTSDVLLPNTFSLFNKLGILFGARVLSTELLTSSKFDLYGRLLDFKSAFTPSCDSINVSNNISRFFIKHFSSPSFIPPLLTDSLFVLLRLTKVFSFRQ